MDLPHVYFGLLIFFDRVILFKHEHSSDCFFAALEFLITPDHVGLDDVPEKLCFLFVSSFYTVFSKLYVVLAFLDT